MNLADDKKGPIRQKGMSIKRAMVVQWLNKSSSFNVSWLFNKNIVFNVSWFKWYCFYTNKKSYGFASNKNKL